MEGIERRPSPRNGLVDFMRLIFSLIVMMFHFYCGGEKHFFGGKFGVEYFVILSGFLFFSAWDRKRIAEQPLEGRQSYWLSYMKKRYIRFFWYALTAFVLIFLTVRVYLNGFNHIGDVLDKLSGDVWEILLVKMNGLSRGKDLLNGPAWTLNCMLFAEFFILGMLTFWERPFLSLFMPMSILFGIGYWVNMESAGKEVMLVFFTFGTLRVYLLTCFGIFSYQLCKKLKLTQFSKTGREMLSVLELAGYAACIWIACQRSSRNYQYCFILIATFVLAISFSGKSFAGSILPANNFTNFCAEFSMSLYLTHYAVLRVFQHYYRDANDLYRQKSVFLFCAFATALVYTFIMRGVFKMLPIAKEKLKSIMLEPS